MARGSQLQWNAAVNEDGARTSDPPARGGALTEVQLDQTWSHWAGGKRHQKGVLTSGNMWKYVGFLDMLNDVE